MNGLYRGNLERERNKGKRYIKSIRRNFHKNVRRQSENVYIYICTTNADLKRLRCLAGIRVRVEGLGRASAIIHLEVVAVEQEESTTHTHTHIYIYIYIYIYVYSHLYM